MKPFTFRLLAVLTLLLAFWIGLVHGFATAAVIGTAQACALAQLAQANPFCLGLKKVMLPTNTAAHTGFTHLIILTFEDLTQTVANTAQTIALMSVLAGDAVFRAATVLKTPFAHSEDSAFNSTAITVGDGGDVDRLIASQQTNVNGTEVLYAVHPSTTPFVFTSADTIDIVFNSMSGKSLSNLDIGELHVYLGLVRMAPLSANAGTALDYSSD